MGFFLKKNYATLSLSLSRLPLSHASLFFLTLPLLSLLSHPPRQTKAQKYQPNKNPEKNKNYGILESKTTYLNLVGIQSKINPRVALIALYLYDFSVLHSDFLCPRTVSLKFPVRKRYVECCCFSEEEYILAGIISGTTMMNKKRMKGQDSQSQAQEHRKAVFPNF